MIRYHYHRRGFLACSLLMMASVGMTAATASLFRSLVYDPIGLPESHRVVAIGGLGQPPPQYDPVLWWSQGTELSNLAYVVAGEAQSDAGDWQAISRVAVASSGFFAVFGLSPLGTDFREIIDGSERVAVVSASFGRSLSQAQEGAIGSTVRIQGVSHRVVGVVPETFDFPDGTEVWVRAMPDPRLDVEILSDGDQRWIGQLAQSATPQSAQTQLLVLLNRMNTEFRARTGVLYGEVVLIDLLANRLSSRFRAPLNLLLLAGGLVLMGAIVTYAVLSLGYGIEKQQAMAIRRVLGATEARLVLEAASEAAVAGVLMAIGGSVVAMAFLWGASTLLSGDLASRSIRFSTFFDATALGLVLAALVTTFGMVVPRLWVLLRSKRLPSLRPEQGRPIQDNYGRFALVALQVALGFLATVFASGALMDYVRITSVDIGYEDVGAMVATLALPRSYVGEGRFVPRLDEVASALKALPGANSVGLTSQLPISNRRASGFFLSTEGGTTFARSELTSPDYFQAMKIPVVLGRSFLGSDREAVIVDERTARVLWPEESPLGKSLLIEGEPVSRVVVGVVGAVSAMDTDTEAAVAPRIYFPFGSPHRPKRIQPTVDAVVRFDRETNELAPFLHALRSLGSDVRVRSISSLHDLAMSAMVGPRAQSVLLSIYAAVSGGVALLGVLNVVAFVARARRFEIGVRLALGGGSTDVALLVAKEGILASTTGVAIGLALTSWVHKALATIVVGIGQPDTSLLALVAVVGVVAGAFASLAPAIRSALENPASILRRE